MFWPWSFSLSVSAVGYVDSIAGGNRQIRRFSASHFGQVNLDRARAKADAALPNGMSALQLAAGAAIEHEARPSDLARFNIVDNDTPQVPRLPEAVTAAVRLLLDAGADATHADIDGDTALHAAAGANQPQIVELLVARGAPVNAKNTDGQTPLSLTLPRKPLARGSGFPGYPEAEAVLRKLGALP